MKIAMLGNQARAMVNFWTVLLRRMLDDGHEVLCFVPDPAPGDDPAWEKALEALGARLVRYPLDRKGLNPFRDLRTLLTLRALLREEGPDLLFAYTIKPVIYGLAASALAAQPPKEGRFAMITGLGYMFEGGSAAKRLLTQAARLLYRGALSRAAAVFFQNHDDRRLFETLSILPPGLRVCMSKGTGVDTDMFRPAPQPQQKTAAPPVFLYVGRLLEAKGVREFIEAARLVRRKYPEAAFRLLGPAESGPGAVPLDEVMEAQRQGHVEYLGEARDVRPYLAEATAVLLPSWREGTPCSLLEAMSCGKPVIAADAPGSREVVRDGHNGILTPLRDPAALAKAVERLIMEPDTAARMGLAGRALAETEFSAQRVAESLLRDMGLRS